MLKNNILKVPLYSNCQVQDPNGIHIFNCSEKKTKWYLKRNLAEIIQGNPLIIRLNFAPRGPGHAHDNFYLQERKNICVCCGTVERLTRHHIIPIMYRHHFPKRLKNHIAYDVLPVCYNCHEKYEGFAQQLKKKLIADCKIESDPIDKDLKKACLYAAALLRSDKIPLIRYNMMMDVIRSFLRKKEISIHDLEDLSKTKYNTHRKNYKSEGQVIVEKLIQNNSLEDFIISWRQHFCTYAAPKFMPQYWHINRKI